MMVMMVVMVVMSESGRELVHHVPEDDGVDVLAQHVQQKPVAHLGPSDDRVNVIPVDETVPHPQEIHLEIHIYVVSSPQQANCTDNLLGFIFRLLCWRERRPILVSCFRFSRTPSRATTKRGTRHET